MSVWLFVSQKVCSDAALGRSCHLVRSCDKKVYSSLSKSLTPLKEAEQLGCCITMSRPLLHSSVRSVHCMLWGQMSINWRLSPSSAQMGRTHFFTRGGIEQQMSSCSFYVRVHEWNPWPVRQLSSRTTRMHTPRCSVRLRLRGLFGQRMNQKMPIETRNTLSSVAVTLLPIELDRSDSLTGE